MDFSLAQRNAHAEEYADLMISLIPSFNSLSPEIQALQRKNLVSESMEAQGGCCTHWQRSVLRVRDTAALVPKSMHPIFDRLTRQLLSDSSTLSEYDDTWAEIRTLFPSLEGWSDWWMKPAPSAMLFPACQRGDRSIRSQVPKTSNPVESRHSLLHRSAGTDFDAIPGIEGIILNVRELKSRYNAIQGNFLISYILDRCTEAPNIALSLSAGVFKAPPPRDPRPRKAKKMNLNDGRAPDTQDALAATSAAKSKSVVKGSLFNMRHCR